MQRKIISFDRDDEGHWRALLDCGHYRHVRHDPPTVERKWVLEETTRNERIGAELECKICERSEREPPRRRDGDTPPS